MMRCLAHFILDSDLCLAADALPLIFQGADGEFTITLSNNEDEGVLSAEIIFEVDSIKNAREIAQNKITKSLNLLTYVTNRKFSVKILKKIVDWTPGLAEREAIVYVETPVWDTAEPELNREFIDTAERLSSMSIREDQQRAMRWYRMAIQAENVEEQFSYFWFALEIAAEALKGSEKVPTKCPRCQSALFCEHCGNHPTHRRYSGEAIQQVVERVHPDDADSVFKTLQLIRHTLMHGGRISSISDQLPCTEYEAINKLAFITWNAIWQLFEGTDPKPEETMSFGYTDNFVRRKIVGSAHVVIGYPGDPNSPKVADFPKIQFDVIKSDSPSQ